MHGLSGGVFFIAAVVFPLLAPSRAQALTVSINGSDWDMRTVRGAFGNGTNVGGINMTDSNSNPWWGSRSAASQFATAVGYQMGWPHDSVTGTPFILPTSPIFAYRLFDFGYPTGPAVQGYGTAVIPNTASSLPPVYSSTVHFQTQITQSDTLWYAYAVYVGITASSGGSTGSGSTSDGSGSSGSGGSTSDGSGTSGSSGSSGGGSTSAGAENVPGPLPALGLAAAFGFSRKLRKRIKLHKGTSDISASTGA